MLRNYDLLHIKEGVSLNKIVSESDITQLYEDLYYFNEYLKINLNSKNFLINYDVRL